MSLSLLCIRVTEPPLQNQPDFCKVYCLITDKVIWLVRIFSFNSWKYEQWNSSITLEKGQPIKSSFSRLNVEVQSLFFFFLSFIDFCRVSISFAPKRLGFARYHPLLWFCQSLYCGISDLVIRIKKASVHVILIKVKASSLFVSAPIINHFPFEMFRC